MRRILLAALMIGAVWTIDGCASRSSLIPENPPAAQDSTQSRVRELENRIKELEARNKELSDRLTPETTSVNLISPDFPPAVAGTSGWEYHKILSADLDSDGHKEQVSVTTNAVWMPEKKEFAWDDGHPWHVYVEEVDGGRTYLFSNWVQTGQLDVILDREGPGLFIVSSRGGGLVVYRAIYRGPGQINTVKAFDIPLSESATWADPLMFSR